MLLPHMRPQSIRSFLRANRRSLLLLLSMSFLYLFSYFQRLAIPGTIFDELQSDFGLSAGGVSLLGAVFLYVYGIMQIPTGILADRFGGARVLLAGGVLLVAGSLLFPLSGSPLVLYFTRALIGVGSSLIYVSVLKEVNELFASRHFAVILGVVLFIGYTGGLVGTFPFERASNAWGWRGSLLGMGGLSLLSLVFLAAALRITRHASRERRIPTALILPLRRVLGNIRGYPVLVAFPLQFSLYFVVQGPIGKKMLEDATRISSARAALVTFVMMAITIACTSVSGLLSRIAGNRRKPLAVSAGALVVVSMLGILLATRLSLPAAGFTVFYFLLAVSTVGSPMFMTTFKEQNPGRAAGTAIGVLNCATYLVIALLSNSAGWVLDRFQDRAVRTAGSLLYPSEAYTVLFAILLAVAVLSFVSTLLIRETRGVQAKDEG